MRGPAPFTNSSTTPIPQKQNGLLAHAASEGANTRIADMEVHAAATIAVVVLPPFSCAVVAWRPVATPQALAWPCGHITGDRRGHGEYEHE